MLKQEFLNKLTEIGTCEDETARRDLIASLRDEASKDYDTITTLTETNTNLTKDNENLRSANMRLFLRLGEEKPTNEPTNKTTNKTEDKPSFEGLFDEKGEIK